MLKAYLHSKLMFSKPYILKADLYSKMEFSKPYIWFTEYMVYRTLLYYRIILGSAISKPNCNPVPSLVLQYPKQTVLADMKKVPVFFPGRE